ncbi:MAG: hypothetical protein ACYCYF_13655, partial [Anaerolineae bacterium]
MKTRRILALLLIIATLGGGLLPATPSAAQDPAGGGGSLEERVMREAIRSLGWPDTVASQPLFQLDEDDDTMFMLWPPGSAVRYFTRTKVSANNGGSSDEETIQYARIVALGEQ